MKELRRIIIPFVAPTLNKWYSSSSWHSRSAAKKLWRTYFQSIKKEIEPLDAADYPVIVKTVSHFSTGRRRDTSNWTSANKLAEDALVEIGVLEDDSLKYVSETRASIHPSVWHTDETVIIIYADEFKLT